MTETIGERVIHAICERAKQNGIKRNAEAAKIGITRKNLWDWENRFTDPQAYFLKQMALAGYDVFWILTGKEKEND